VQLGPSSMDASQQVPKTMMEEAAAEDAEVPEQQSLTNWRRNVARTLPDGVTTLTILNIPVPLSKQHVLQRWPTDGTYNFRNLTFSFKKLHRCGIAITNVTSYQTADVRNSHQDGIARKNVDGSRDKNVDVGADAVQCFFENVWHFKRLNIEKLRNDELLPMAFKSTRQLDIEALLAQSDRDAFDEQDLELFVSRTSASAELASCVCGLRHEPSNAP